MPVLKDYGFTATIFVVTGEIGGQNSWDQKEGLPALQCMSEEQIKHYAEQGMDFGVHSRTHANLTLLTTDSLEEEIKGSHRDLAHILGMSPQSFAYPRGLQNETTRSCVEKYYQAAFTCDEGLNKLNNDYFQLSRILVKPKDSMLTFTSRIKLGFSFMERLRSRICLRTRLQKLFI